ncbi:MAG: MarR family winged helix-turn-helix transcriptional regulator [Solirubrobacteraceae bacterium]|jgi:DNA-binding MarR family transcriptional regulator
MPDRLAQLLGALSLAATDRFRSAVEGSLGRAGAHAAALVHLHVHPGASVRALAAVLGVSQPAAVKIVDRLAGDALLERRPGADRRALALRLTNAGRAQAVRILAGRAGELTGLLAVLDAEERERLEPLLEKLVASLAQELPGALAVCRLCDREACSDSRGGCPLAHTVA